MREIIRARFVGDARETIAYCADVGIHTVMLTYDGIKDRLIKRPTAGTDEKIIAETPSITAALSDYLQLVSALSLRFRDEIRGTSNGSDANNSR